ncbi:hypothetical protein AMR72_16215 [Flavobacterium psychrophilum]|nr:hypothetical protein AMR72_16215 [Flavobacterium psychrophilum]AOE53911.1 hypothetical protein ALW18_16205 [Flavobacterium psychrophilum]
MRHYLLLLFIGFSLCFTSCRDDFEFERSTGGLEFSRDTVYLDTVFTNIGSSTYTLKVYNRSNKDITIPTIALGEGEQSKYRLMVDGKPGKVFNNVELLAKDSMFVFIETTIDYTEYANNETTFLYNDQILFDSGANQQKVELVTLVQDAVFLYPQRDDQGNYEAVPTSDTDPQLIYGFNLDDTELNWTNTKPYVIYGMATVPQGKTLTINPGVKAHFHDGSGLLVRRGASLKIGNEGDTPTPENKVIFEGDRLEPEFSDAPGQWVTVWIQEGSTGNNLNNLIIKNAVVGILMEASTGTIEALRMNNTEIYNCGNIGILARRANINGQNLVINNAGQASLALTGGGNYNFKHCTFANYFGSFNQVPVLINDYYETVDAINVSNVNATFDNCIIYGSSNVGVSLEYKFPNDTAFKCAFNNCLIKMVDFSNQLRNNPLYPRAANNPELVAYNNCLTPASSVEDRPDFQDARNSKLNLGEATGGPNGSADPTIAATVPNDITGALRNTSAPDMGAYESKAFPEE